MELDNLSYLSLKNQVTDFPVHYHETYCISLIQKGVERLDLGNQSHFGEAGSVTVTHPLEVHAQPVIDSNFPPGFDTIYLSEDLMKYCAQSSGRVHLQRKINDPTTSQKLLNLRDAIELRTDTEIALKAFVESLKPYQVCGEFTLPQEADLPWLDEVKGFIEYNLSSKINLNELAAIANLNKFGFSKTFKNHTGMSPMNYVLMQKVFSAKQRISVGSSLTMLAYEFDFTDLAHFSKTFKRFVGISPQQYKVNLR